LHGNAQDVFCLVFLIRKTPNGIIVTGAVVKVYGGSQEVGATYQQGFANAALDP
jgi:hypothetical protein